MEAIFLTSFVLINQNEQEKVAERRNHLDLQINLLVEQENSKMLSLLSALMNHLQIPCDPEVAALEQTTDPAKLTQQIQNSLETTGSG